MGSLKLKGQWVLVTGATSGLGRSMAVELAAKHGANLVVTGRRADRLEELREQLTAKHGTRVVPVTADLSKLDDVDRLFREATQDRALHGAILNAGVTHFGRHEDLGWEAFQAMLATNVTAVVRLASHLVPALTPQQGGLMIVSSLAGLNPVPYQTAYSATKSFLVSYGCGLAQEVSGTGVSVTTFAPGGIATEMTSVAQFGELTRWLMPVDRVAAEGVKALVERRYLHVPGAAYRWGAYFTRLLPQRLVHSAVARTYRQSLEAARRKGSV